MRISWKKVKISPALFDWGIQEYGFRASDLELLNYLHLTPNPSPNDPLLIERIGIYYELNRKEFVKYFECLERSGYPFSPGTSGGEKLRF